MIISSLSLFAAIMEGAADDAIVTTGEGQQQTTVASSLTSMTGNGNEILQANPQSVDEFDTDSKWEITPLQKASFDCSDMYNETSPDQQQNPAQAPESASDTNQSADCADTKTDDSQEMTEMITENQAKSTSDEDKHPLQATTESNQDQAAAVVIAESSDNKAIETRSPTANVTNEPTEATSPPTTNTLASAENTDQQPLKVEETFAPQQLQSKDLDEVLQNDNIDSTDKADSLSPHHQQDDGSFVLSQTAVDPQMEKMIDNIVEHGGCQQFAETLQQRADEIDREKEVENIQREISMASNSFMKDDESEEPDQVTLQPSSPSEEQNGMKEHHSEDKKEEPNQESQEAEANEQPMDDDEPNKDIEEEKKEIPMDASEENPVLDTQTVEPTPVVMEEDPKKEDDSTSALKTVPQSTVPTRASKRQKVVEEKEEVKDDLDDKSETDKPVADKRTLPERPVRQARIKAAKRAASPEPEQKEAPEKRKKSKDLEPVQERPTKLLIKVPLPSRSASARKTIATSAPSTVASSTIHEAKKVANSSFNEFDCKKYRCEKCKYSTDRLNNIVHHKKSACSFFQQHYADHVAAQVESWRRSIQSPKSNSKRSAR